jgi:CRISPR-associated protein Cmr6
MISPTEIREILSPQRRIEQETNAGLWFDKYITKQDREDTESRRCLIEEVCALPIPTAYRSYFERWQQALIDEYGAQTRRAQVKGRMIVGLGSESVLETSISLHRTYGVPYIPGSALKGLAANYARLRLGEGWQKGGKYYKVVFGNTDDAGYITFFDALYVPDPGPEKKALYPDVITVHHQSYYQGANDAPADTDNPTPVPFLSATGIYLIALAAPDLQHPDRWLAATFKIVEEAFKTFGVGAKTSSGYGRLELKIDNKDRPPTSTGSVRTVQPKSVEHIRPKIPQFREGQDITGSVVAPTDDLWRIAPSETRAFLRYQSFATKDVLMVVSAEEAQNWKPGETRICLFVREEERDGCTLLVCQPRPNKKKKG